MPRTVTAQFAALLACLSLLAACSGGAADPNTLVVLAQGPSGEVRFLQMGSGTVVDRVQVGGEPHRLARDTERGRVYVADRAGDTVSVVDVLGRSMLKQVRVGREPQFLALAPDGRRLYVTVGGEGALVAVDAESLEVVGRAAVGNRPMGLAVSADGARVYVASDADESITIVDTTQFRRIARPVPVAGGVHGALALSTDGATLLSGTTGRPAIVAMSPGTRDVREVRELALGPAAAQTRAIDAVLATPDGRYWVAAPAGTSDVVALPSGGGDPKPVRADEQPSGLAVAPGGRLLVASRDGETLAEIDLEKGKVTRRIRIGPGHTDLAVFSKSSLDALRAKQGG